VALTGDRRVGNSRTFEVVVLILYWIVITVWVVVAITRLAVEPPSGMAAPLGYVLAAIVCAGCAGLGWLSVRHVRRGASWDGSGVHIRAILRSYDVPWRSVDGLVRSDTVIKNAVGTAGSLATYRATGQVWESWSFAQASVDFREGDTDDAKPRRVAVSSSHHSSQRVMLSLLAATPADHPLRQGLPEPYRSATSFTMPAGDPAEVTATPVLRVLRMPFYLPVIYFGVELLFAVLIATGGISALVSSQRAGDTYPVVGDSFGAVLFGVPLLILIWCMTRIWFVRSELRGAGMVVHRVWGRAQALPGSWILGFTAVEINQGSQVRMHLADGVMRNLLAGAGLGQRGFEVSDELNEWLTKHSHPPQLLGGASTDADPGTTALDVPAAPAMWHPVVDRNAPHTSHRVRD
jgi:hypothetical protein